MSAASAANADRALRRLFLALFLRGRGARGLRKDSTPGSIARKLFLTLGLYALLGLFLALSTSEGATSTFVVSLYMHAMTFAVLGMFVAGSAGEVLFNKEEAEILMHRPVTPQALLRAKITVMLQVALWMAGALNLGVLLYGSFGPRGDPGFLPAHAVSLLMSAVFSISFVVATYQLGLRWFGRERLDNMLTTVQVIIAVGFFAGMQLLPQLMIRFPGAMTVTADTQWMFLLPPAWFAGIDNALLGERSTSTLILAALGIVSAFGVTYLATGTLAGSFGRGLQKVQDVAVPRVKSASNRWLHRLVRTPPLSWWLRDPVARSSFLLACAYMFRDRETKLRLYPGLAPMLILPLIWMLGAGTRGQAGSQFGFALGGGYMCVIPIVAINMLEFSQQWQASDVFRYAPLAGPASLLNGVRRAVLVLLALPMFVAIALLGVSIAHGADKLVLLVPSLISLPVFAMLGSLIGTPVPLSRAAEEAKSAGRGAMQIIVMFAAIVGGFITLAAWKSHHMTILLVVESAMALGAYVMCRQLLQDSRWRPVA